MWRKDKKEQEQTADWKDKVARRLAHKIIAAQIYIVERLQKWEHRLSTRQKKAIFFTYFIMCSGYLLYLLGNAALKPSPHLSLPDRIHMPSTAKPPLDTVRIIPKDTMQFIH